jgi:phosphoserine phosphatase RsbU/P
MSRLREQSRLEALLESVRLLHSSLELDDLVRHLLRSAMGRLMARSGFIALQQPAGLRLVLVRGTTTLRAGEPIDEALSAAAGIDLLIPIGEAGNPVGLLGLGKPPAGGFDSGEEEFTRALVSVGASAIVNARAHTETTRLNRLLDRKIEDLKTLLDLGRALVISAVDPEEVARVLGLTLAGHWAVARFAVVAWKPGQAPVIRQRGLKLPDLEVVRSLLPELPAAALVTDLPDGALKEALLQSGVDAVFPLLSMQPPPFGLVALGRRPPGRSFGEAEFEFAEGLLAQAVVAFENAWAFREALEKKQMEKELSVAASIQEGLFPSALPALPDVRVAARTRPARQVGGDYYDAIPAGAPGEERHIFCVADVTGKGLPASLIMSSMQASLRALANTGLTLCRLAVQINELLYATTPGNRFVTAVLVLIDGHTGACRIVNAGHNEALRVTGDGQSEAFNATGMALGLFPGAGYEELTLTMNPGDLLALYSDGVTEALNTAEEEFGVSRLTDCLARHSAEEPDAIVNAVFAELDDFVGTAPQHDDITFLVLKRG